MMRRLARQIDDARLPAVGNASPYRNLFLRAVSIADNHPLKIYRAAADAQLDGAVGSSRPAHFDAVMVL